MTDLRAGAQQALEALESSRIFVITREKTKHPEGTEWYDSAITALREALAQAEQEPVAWGVFEGNLHDMFFSQSEAKEMAALKGTHAEVRPLYTAPPAAQRPWQGLTDEEIWSVVSRIGTSDSNVNPLTVLSDARAIEQRLKERNT